MQTYSGHLSNMQIREEKASVGESAEQEANYRVMLSFAGPYLDWEELSIRGKKKTGNPKWHGEINIAPKKGNAWDVR